MEKENIKNSQIDDKLCCGKLNSNKKEKNATNSIFASVMAALIPHSFCIAFILASILGVSFAIEILKPFLLDRNFFYYLIIFSIVGSTLSAIFYLHSNSLLSIQGVKKKWKYLLTLYGSTIFVNLILFLFIFPLATNISLEPSSPLSLSNSNKTMSALSSNSKSDLLEVIKIQVDIPCSGHATLISEELKKLFGVKSVRFDFPNYFTISFDSSQTTKDQIFSLEIFRTYPAILIQENSNFTNQKKDSLESASLSSTTKDNLSLSCAISLSSCGCGCAQNNKN
ncbi:MAG: hypothetical protein QXH71_03025 [Candidatus Anstonellaceae archaeon]